MAKHRLNTRPNYTAHAVALMVVAVLALLAAWVSATDSPNGALLAVSQPWDAQPVEPAVASVAVPAEACAEMVAARFEVDSWTVTGDTVQFEVVDPEERRELAAYAASFHGLQYVVYNGMANVGNGWATVQNPGDRNSVLLSFGDCRE